MLRNVVFAGVFLGSFLPLCVVAAPRRSATLSKSQQEVINKRVIPAHRLGNPSALIRALSPALAKMSEGQVAEANQLLTENEIPTIGELLADARLLLVQQGNIDRLPTPKGRELLLTLRVLHDRIGATLAAQDKHAIMSDPLTAPKKLHAYKENFWDVHVLDNQLINARRLTEYAAHLQRGARFNPKSINDEDRAAIAMDYSKLILEIDRRRQEMEEREIELRIKRIHAAVEVLKSDSPSAHRFADSETIIRPDGRIRRTVTTTTSTAMRFLAAYTLGTDGFIVQEFFGSRELDKRKRFIRMSLRDTSLPQHVRETVKQAVEANRELVDKTKLLFVGLHWWFRGRYGSGPNAWGLVKSPQALKSEQAQFPLFMPVTTPQPTDPTNRDVRQVPAVDRRHHYTWATEYRPFVETVSTSSGSTVTSTTSQSEFKQSGIRTTHLSRFY